MHAKMRCRRTYLCIALLLIVSITSPTAAQQNDQLPVPTPPLTWAEALTIVEEQEQPEGAQSRGAGEMAAAAAGCTSRACLYLPNIVNSGAAGVGRSRAEALAIYRSLYIPSQNVSAGWTGNVGSCSAGATSSAFLNAVQQRINYYRQMAGLASVQPLNGTYNRKTQAAALMMSANNALSHTPPSGWKCYSAEGAQAAGSANLFLGSFGAAAIDGYIRDPGAPNTPAGHRRWILLPQTTTMGAGDIPSGGQPTANALWIFDASINNPRPATRYPFVAWPPPGYVSYNTVYPRWSFALKDADFSQSTVKVTKGGAVIAATVYKPANGYGENALVWQINGMGDWDTWPRPTADTTYTVAIQKVLTGGAYKNFTYTVTIFDPAR
jgi:uncharacterized protein YkwD